MKPTFIISITYALIAACCYAYQIHVKRPGVFHPSLVVTVIALSLGALWVGVSMSTLSDEVSLSFAFALLIGTARIALRMAPTWFASLGGAAIACGFLITLADSKDRHWYILASATIFIGLGMLMFYMAMSWDRRKSR